MCKWRVDYIHNAEAKDKPANTHVKISDTCDKSTIAFVRYSNTIVNCMEDLMERCPKSVFFQAQHKHIIE